MALGKLKSIIGHMPRRNTKIEGYIIMLPWSWKHWKSVKERIPLKEGIVVNFSGNHDNYYSAYRYIYKDDDSVHHSKHHPNLDDVALPWTKSQPKPTNKLKNHMPRKTQLTLHKNEAESKMQEMSNSIWSQWAFIKKQ